MKVGVLGAGGRMGSSVCAAVDADTRLELVAAVDPVRAGTGLVLPSGATMQVSGRPQALEEAGAEVAVDFTTPGVVGANAAYCAGQGMHMVIGTTGLGAAGEADLARLYPPDGPLGCVLAANFAIGAVLSMRFAELAAPWFDTAEIIELHHDAKLDAPSGTALRTAERMAAASSSWGADPTRTETVRGVRGGTGPGGIHIHSVRLRGLVAHQEVLFGSTGETLTIRHDSLERSSFMPGVVLAVIAVATLPGLTVGLEAILGL